MVTQSRTKKARSRQRGGAKQGQVEAAIGETAVGANARVYALVRACLTSEWLKCCFVRARWSASGCNGLHVAALRRVAVAHVTCRLRPLAFTAAVRVVPHKSNRSAISDYALSERAASLSHGVVRYTSTGTWSGSACSVWSHGTGRHTAVQVCVCEREREREEGGGGGETLLGNNVHDGR